jgi:hypothetical protein
MEIRTVAEVLPAGPPLTEQQQIGRHAARDSCQERLLEGSVLILMEPRRVGKTSFARAALARVAAAGGQTAELQLTSYPDPELAATELARQLVGGLDRVVEPSRRSLDRLRGLSAPADAGGEAPLLADLAKALLGDARGFPAVFAHAIDHLPADGHGAVLLDEAHVIAQWPKPLQDALCLLLRANSRLGVVIASSETRALNELVGPGGALQYAGYRFPLPAIDPGDWRTGLRERFVLLGLSAQDELLDRLIELAGAHPYRTMRLAQETARVARSLPSTAAPAPVGNGDLEAALLTVRSDPAWTELG